MNIVSISGIDLDDDKGEAPFIRMGFIHKGIKLEQVGALDIYSYYTNHSYLTKSDRLSRGYLFAPNIGKNKIAKTFTSFVNSFAFLLFLFRIPKNSVILIDTLPLNLILPFIFFKIFRKNIVLAQYYEFLVFHIPPKRLLSRALMKFNFFLLKKSLKYIDILIVISHEHEKYYRKYLKKDSLVLIVPMLLDYYSKSEPQQATSQHFRICYAGAISKSNGLEILIEAIKGLENVQLSIYGFSTKDYKEYLNSLITNYSLINQVFVYDSVPNNQMISILKSQDLLVIPKLKDNRSLGYIPSKLGDFLHSETPVLCTDVGELNKYILDGENGFLVESDSVRLMQDKIQSIKRIGLEGLGKIGTKGKEVSILFHYTSQVQRIIATIQRVIDGSK